MGWVHLIYCSTSARAVYCLRFRSFFGFYAFAFTHHTRGFCVCVVYLYAYVCAHYKMSIVRSDAHAPVPIKTTSDISHLRARGKSKPTEIEEEGKKQHPIPFTRACNRRASALAAQTFIFPTNKYATKFAYRPSVRCKNGIDVHVYVNPLASSPPCYITQNARTASGNVRTHYANNKSHSMRSSVHACLYACCVVCVCGCVGSEVHYIYFIIE